MVFHLVIYLICSVFIVAPTLCVLVRISYFKSRVLILSLMVIDIFYCQTQVSLPASLRNADSLNSLKNI